jgi:probable HAF family extracellular repeat protein
MPIYNYATLDDPGGGAYTEAFDINDTGQVVGAYLTASGTHGFLYSGGTYVTLDDPFAANNTIAEGINGAGGGAADGLNTVALSTDTSHQQFLTTPQHV